MINAQHAIRKATLTLAALCLALLIPASGSAQSTAQPVTIKGPRMMIIPETATYTITVANTERATSTGSRIILRIPSEMQLLETSPKGLASSAGEGTPTTATWALGSMQPGKIATITFTVKAVRKGTASLNVEYMDSLHAEHLRTNAETKIIGAPRMKIGIYDTEDPVTVGKNTTYVLEVANIGSAPASSVRFAYVLPEKMKFIKATVPSGMKFGQADNTILFSSCPLMDMNQKITVRIECQAISTGSTTGTAVLTYDQRSAAQVEVERTSVSK